MLLEAAAATTRQRAAENRRCSAAECCRARHTSERQHDQTIPRAYNAAPGGRAAIHRYEGAPA